MKSLTITAERLAKILLQHPKARVYVENPVNMFSCTEPIIDNVYNETNPTPYCKSIKFVKNEKSGREKIILNYF